MEVSPENWRPKAPTPIVDYALYTQCSLRDTSSMEPVYYMLVAVVAAVGLFLWLYREDR
jgi:hypothetical protein